LGFIIAFGYVIFRIILLLYLLKAEQYGGKQEKFVENQVVGREIIMFNSSE